MSGTSSCPACGIDEPHSVESLKANLREALRIANNADDGDTVRREESWADHFEQAIAAHEAGAQK